MRHNVLHGIFHEIEHVVCSGARRFFHDIDRIYKCGIPLLLCDKTRIVHFFYNIIRTFIGDVHFVLAFLFSRIIKTFIGVFTRIRSIGCLDHPGNHRTFAYGQFGKFFSKIILCSRFDAII